MGERALDWVASADRGALADAGWAVVAFDELLRGARDTGSGARAPRTSLANPAQAWLHRLVATPRMAVVGVRLTTLPELRVLHGHVLEPASTSGIRLLVQSEQRLRTLVEEDFVDPGFGYAYTLERALATAMRLFVGRGEPPAPRACGSPREDLDVEQRRAVAAHDGVVQVIAPAGSGKTTVLVERVRELHRRGVAPGQILCATFNKAAATELQQRLELAGVGGVRARTFHGLGLWLLVEEGVVDGAATRSPTLNQWKRLCALAARDEGTWIEPIQARAAVSDAKLGLLATAAEYRAHVARLENGAVLARIYELYEEMQRASGAIDFDDHVMLAVRALRDDGALRARWQARFAQVLVDEYQDVEPAQELLVRILAAPQDGYFCVGDEDQTLYGWRRASVRRMIDLDLAYPGLQRISLAHNYRCPPEVVSASRRLVERNVVRFPKPIESAPGRADGGTRALELREDVDHRAGAGRIARALAGRRRGDVVVLARTTNLLTTVALACIAPQVRISAPRAVFEPSGSRRALEAYLRLMADLGSARPEDVAIVCRAPGRGLPLDCEDEVAARLCAGRTFAAAFAGLATDARGRARLQDAGQVLDVLAGIAQADRFVSHLRAAGGLDAYFAAYERTFGDAEQVELEILDQIAAEARDRTVSQLSALLDARAHALRDIRDDERGIELSTIHGAKGREWPEVWVFGCDEGQLPHGLALQATAEQTAAGEGLEAERRLAYVAFTRARERLVVCATESAPSRFASEAGLAPKRPYAPPAPVVTRDVRQRRSHRPPRTKAEPRTRQARVGPADGRLAKAVEIGLGYAMRTAPTPAIALQTAAAALEQRLVGDPTTSAAMTAAKLVANVEGLTAADGAGILRRAGISDDGVLLTGLDDPLRVRLAETLRGSA
ncbi:MAG TPA: ATP-dependent helicase [Solirubrobacteraceae bacterium]